MGKELISDCGADFRYEILQTPERIALETPGCAEKAISSRRWGSRSPLL